MKNRSIGVIVLLALLMLGSCTGISRNTKTAASQPFWQLSTPEEQGVDSATLVRLLEYIEKQGTAVHSLLVIRNGYIILEAYSNPYTSDKKHILNSVTKSFLSALAGIAIDKGFIRNVNSSMLEFFPEYSGSKNDPLKSKVTIDHLLTMTSGIDWPQYGANNISNQMTNSNDWVQFILTRPMAAEPGSRFNYSNGDAQLLSAIIQKATGETTFDFGWENLFKPLGISDIEWDSDPKGITIGSATMYLTSRDMAKLGYLYLNEGKWEGKSLVSADWVRASLTSHTKAQVTAGYADYGYYWWIYPEPGLYEAWGGAGQRIGILPDLNIVTVMTSDISDDAPVTSFSSEIYRFIRQSAKSRTALPDNPEASAEVARHVLAWAKGNH